MSIENPVLFAGDGPADEERAELLALLAKATPGPWFYRSREGKHGGSWIADSPRGTQHGKIIVVAGSCYSGSDDYELIAAAVNALPRLLALPPASVGGWKTIESAPRDGTRILACSIHHDGCEVVCWQDGEGSGNIYTHDACQMEGWVNDGTIKDRFHANPRWFTHWQPVPAAPSPPVGEGLGRLQPTASAPGIEPEQSSEWGVDGLADARAAYNDLCEYVPADAGDRFWEALDALRQSLLAPEHREAITLQATSKGGSEPNPPTDKTAEVVKASLRDGSYRAFRDGHTDLCWAMDDALDIIESLEAEKATRDTSIMVMAERCAALRARAEAAEASLASERARVAGVVDTISGLNLIDADDAPPEATTDEAAIWAAGYSACLRDVIALITKEPQHG